MTETGQLPLHEPSQPLGGGVLRWMHSLRPGKVSCTTLYAMHLASGVPVDRTPGLCPVCGSCECKLARALAHRGA